MKIGKLKIEEFGLQKTESKELILNILNSQINDYKVRQFSSWLKNQSHPSELTERKIEELKSKRNDVETFFGNCFNDPTMDITISIEVKVKDETVEKKSIQIEKAKTVASLS